MKKKSNEGFILKLLLKVTAEKKKWYCLNPNSGVVQGTLSPDMSCFHEDGVKLASLSKKSGESEITATTKFKFPPEWKV